MIIIFLFIIAGLIVRNYLLSPVLFYDWDEGMYAQIAQEILKNKSLFTTFNSHVWLDKPPLVHALIAFIFQIFSRSEFWSRMLMVIVSMLLLYLTYLLAKKITKKNGLASILPVLILSASPIFLERATMLNSDTFVAVSWLGYFLFWEKFWPKLFFLTFGVWSKSVLGFYPLIFDLLNLFIYRLTDKKLIKINSKIILKNLLLVVTPSLWYIAGYIKYGWYFIDNHFVSQVFKRIYVPIELHFGGKFFYLDYLWKQLGLMNLLFVIGYLLFGFNLFKKLYKKKINSLEFALLSPFPFLILLTFMKTKITWYVVIFLPFLTLIVSYFYINLKNKFLRLALFSTLVIYFFINFISQTFLLKVDYRIPEKLLMAKCLSKLNSNKIAFLVDEEERKIKNFLEAAHYDTTSSFFYGGSPSFVYYSQKNIDFYYDINEFLNKYANYSQIVISKKDLAQIKKNFFDLKQINCEHENWISIVK